MRFHIFLLCSLAHFNHLFWLLLFVISMRARAFFQKETALYFSSQLNFGTTTKRLIIRTNTECHPHCQRRLRLQAKCVCCCGKILHYKNDIIFKQHSMFLSLWFFLFFIQFYIHMVNQTVDQLKVLMKPIKVHRLILQV